MPTPVDLTIRYIGGNCPVQSEGTLAGVPYYFRARGKHWTLYVGQDPLSDEAWSYQERYADPDAKGFDRDPDDADPYAAGWMTEDEARAFIDKAARLYVESL